MLSILVVTVVGCGFVLRGFWLIKQFGNPAYKGREKELIHQLLISGIIFFCIALVVAFVLKLGNFEQ
jgi:hypothetical protein